MYRSWGCFVVSGGVGMDESIKFNEDTFLSYQKMAEKNEFPG